MFNEVFLTDTVREDDAAIGGINNGWAVANTTLMFERSGLGAGGGGGGVAPCRARSAATWSSGPAISSARRGAAGR